jgi:hypothetical protein
MRKIQKKISNNKSTREFSRWNADVMNRSKNMRRIHKMNHSTDWKERRQFSN